MERYIRNERMLSPEENRRLRTLRVAIVGCGGLGGYIIEMLARLGVGHLTLIDGDVFEPSNLNRQIFSTPNNLGEPKAREAKNRVRAINPEVTTEAVYEFLTDNNAAQILAGHNLIIDALDNIQSRRIVEKAAESLNTPLVFGAIAGWYAQVCTILPGDRMVQKIFPDEVNKGAETLLGNPSFTPALAASIQVAEALKVLLGKGQLLRNKLLMIDLLEHHYEVVEL
ncbi:MAG: HesA/MoeB/ThiF family protein [Bacteroidales bacterium]|jgi:molybdopterin/thiamine biosynthesis adenylyltransferase|nr:HesA/MoeB/ThiF family protein [Bacteroidales bacterium]NLM93684.1 HesA/MoeB/ThiF family protein [Bacteroidales bacterium]